MFIPGSNGIPEWISNQKNGFRMRMELPWGWYENDDFLGFVLCSLYGPVDVELMKKIKSAKEKTFHCRWYLYDGSSAAIVNNEFRFERIWECSCQEDESNRVWLIYHSKSDIPKKHHSNEWRTMEASFNLYLGTDPMNAERCGFHFLFAHDYEHNNPTTTQGNNYRSVVQGVSNFLAKL